MIISRKAGNVKRLASGSITTATSELVLTLFNNIFELHRLHIFDFTPTSTGSSLLLQYYGGGVWKTSAYRTSQSNHSQGSGPYSAGGTAQSGIKIARLAQTNGASECSHSLISMYDFGNLSRAKTAFGNGTGLVGSSNTVEDFGGSQDTTSGVEIEQVRLICSAGNIGNLKYCLEGYKLGVFG